MRPRIKLGVREKLSRINLEQSRLLCWSGRVNKNSVSIINPGREVGGSEIQFDASTLKGRTRAKGEWGDGVHFKEVQTCTSTKSLNKLFVSCISLIRSMAYQTPIKYKTIKITQPQAQKVGDHTWNIMRRADFKNEHVLWGSEDTHKTPWYPTNSPYLVPNWSHISAPSISSSCHTLFQGALFGRWFGSRRRARRSHLRRDGWFGLGGRDTYRVSHLVADWVLLTWILDVPPSCLGWNYC